MSGNGIRCLAQAAVDAGLAAPPVITVATAGGQRTVEYTAGTTPGLATARVDMGAARLGPDQPHEFGASGRARSTWATLTSCSSVPTLPVWTSPRPARSSRPRTPAGSTWSGSPSSTTRRGRCSSSGSGSAASADAACGTGSVAAAAAARAGRRGRPTARYGCAIRGILEVTLGADGRPRPYLAGPVRKVADIDIHPGCSLEQPVAGTLIERARPGAHHPRGRHLSRADTAELVDEELDELARLVDSAGADVVGAGRATAGRAGPGHLRGRGQGRRDRRPCRSLDVDTVVFDDELSPAQHRNLEKLFGRTGHRPHRGILDIFAGTRAAPRARRKWSLRCCATGCHASAAGAPR